jgi:hypothetical protein
VLKRSLYHVTCPEKEEWCRIEKRNTDLRGSLFIVRNIFEVLKSGFELLAGDEERVEIARSMLRVYSACGGVADLIQHLGGRRHLMSGDITPSELGDGWPIAAPYQQGMDATKLSAIGPRFAGWPKACAHAVVVARHGTLVYEHYFFRARIGAGRHRSATSSLVRRSSTI